MVITPPGISVDITGGGVTFLPEFNFDFHIVDPDFAGSFPQIEFQGYKPGISVEMIVFPGSPYLMGPVKTAFVPVAAAEIHTLHIFRAESQRKSCTGTDDFFAFLVISYR